MGCEGEIWGAEVLNDPADATNDRNANEEEQGEGA
jgi:hypothetical protein